MQGEGTEESTIPVGEAWAAGLNRQQQRDRVLEVGVIPTCLEAVMLFSRHVLTPSPPLQT